jgi:general secretion pathway protein G
MKGEQLQMTRTQSVGRRTCSFSTGRGFTLIELLIVVTLVSVLAGMATAQYRHSVDYARESVLARDLAVMREAIDQYYADKGQFPATLEALAADHYVRTIPDDPFTKSASTWQTVPAEPDATNPLAQTGVYDIHSGSDRMSLDGRRYSDW